MSRERKPQSEQCYAYSTKYKTQFILYTGFPGKSDMRFLTHLGRNKLTGAPCTLSSHRFHPSRPQNGLCSPVLAIQKPFQYLPAPAANSSKQRVKYREDHEIVSSSDRSRKVDSPRMPLALSAGSCCAMQSLSTNTTKVRLETLRRLCQKQRKKTKTSHSRQESGSDHTWGQFAHLIS